MPPFTAIHAVCLVSTLFGRQPEGQVASGSRCTWRGVFSGTPLWGILKGGLRKKIIGLKKVGLRKIISKQQQIIKNHVVQLYSPKPDQSGTPSFSKNLIAFDAACDGLATMVPKFGEGVEVLLC